MKYLIFFLLFPCSLTAQNALVSFGNTQKPTTASMAVSPTSTINMTSVTGSQGSSISHLFSWASWIGTNVTVTLGGSGFVWSPDNVNWFSTTQTYSPAGVAGNTPFYVAMAASNGVGPFSGTITYSAAGVSSVVYSMSGTTTGSTITPDTMGFFFDSTHIVVPGMFEVRNASTNQHDPSKNLITGTIAGTTITYSSVSTSPTNWNPSLGGICTNAGNGSPGSSIPVGAIAVMNECWYTAAVFDTTKPQFVTTGWKTDGTTYDITISGTTNASFGLAALTVVYVRGTVLIPAGGQALQGYQGSGNQTHAVTWTNVIPGVGGTFTFYMGKNASGEQAGVMSYITIKKH